MSLLCSGEESSSIWQQSDYKLFSPDIDWKNINWSSSPAIQHTPVQSAITTVAGVLEFDKSSFIFSFSEWTALFYLEGGGGGGAHLFSPR